VEFFETILGESERCTMLVGSGVLSSMLVSMHGRPTRVAGCVAVVLFSLRPGVSLVRFVFVTPAAPEGSGMIQNNGVLIISTPT
jgi:hypothetical protein